MNDFDKQFKRPSSNYLVPSNKIKTDKITKYVINQEETNKTAKFFEDDLAATDFIKKGLNTEQFDDIFNNELDDTERSEDLEIPVLYDLNEILEENKLDDENKTHMLNKAREEAISLVGYKEYNEIINLYKQLEQKNQVSDSHLQILDEFIKTKVDNTKYPEVNFYNASFLKFFIK
jgi:hypothetical protein